MPRSDSRASKGVEHVNPNFQTSLAVKLPKADSVLFRRANAARIVGPPLTAIPSTSAKDDGSVSNVQCGWGRRRESWVYNVEPICIQRMRPGLGSDFLMCFSFEPPYGGNHQASRSSTCSHHNNLPSCVTEYDEQVRKSKSASNFKLPSNALAIDSLHIRGAGQCPLY